MRFSQPPTNCVDTEGSRRLRPDHRRCRYRPPAVPGPEIQGSNTNERVDLPDCSVSTANANLLHPARSSGTGLGCGYGQARVVRLRRTPDSPMMMRKRDDADHKTGSAGLRGLLVRDPYASQLLDGEKIWEIRGRSTHIRGPILIIKSGTGQLFGTQRISSVCWARSSSRTSSTHPSCRVGSVRSSEPADFRMRRRTPTFLAIRDGLRGQYRTDIPAVQSRGYGCRR